MATGYVLVVAVLILGGVIATLGDRIGMRVGKARLSLFRLRPRQTATVVSILTGSVISASTLALLFGVSRQLRTGVFELEQIQSDLSQARTDLSNAQNEKTQIESALEDARQRQQQAQDELKEIDQSLDQAVTKQQATQEELQQTQTQLGQLRSQLGTVSQQAQQLRSEIQRLDAERAELLRQQETVQGQIAERDREIANRDLQIAQREQILSQLQAQQAVLQEDVETLERQYEGLFRGSVVVGRNQSLVAGLIRVANLQEARQAVDRLLRQANRAAIREIAPGTSTDRQVILIPQEEVTQVVNRISDRQEYVVRVLSTANYIIGEPCVVAAGDPCVQVFISAVTNEVIYDQNERLATVAVNPGDLTNQALVEKLNLLIASLQFRARQDGIVGDTLQVADGRTEALLAFLDEIKRSGRPVDIQAIAAEPIYTIGPLQVELLAVSDGEVLARTDELPKPPPSENEDTNTPNLLQ
ncbi:MAG: DUF3084 domain-containing protein [Leptolyngbya sp. SIO1D8]|nr:DUF3084 domain-containing protein [Leptolyngbya sp. SIO1D8]